MQTQRKSRRRAGNEKRPWRKLLLAGILMAACFGAGVGDTLYVGRHILPIRSGKFAFDKVVGTANQGDTVKVTGVEGKYLKVLYAPKDKPPVEGYVMEAALSIAQPETRPALANVAAGKGVTENDLQNVAAGKGVLDSNQFARSKGLSQLPLESMEAESQKVMSDSDSAFMDFMKAGKIGLYKPAPTPNP